MVVKGCELSTEMRGAHGGKQRQERRRKKNKEGIRERGRRRKRRQRERGERWHNRWYILPGGSQGRGEGGSAIRQHTQREVGKTLAVVIEIGRRGRQRRRETQEGNR